MATYATYTYCFGLLAVLILMQFISSVLVVAAVRLGIREYFRQKRLFLAYMLQTGAPGEEEFKGEVKHG